MFTTHTPEEAGNEKHDIYLCHKMSYFCGLPLDEVRKLTGIEDDHSIIHWLHCVLHILPMAFRNCMVMYREQCGANMQYLPDYFNYQCTELAVLGR